MKEKNYRQGITKESKYVQSWPKVANTAKSTTLFAPNLSPLPKIVSSIHYTLKYEQPKQVAKGCP